MGKFVVAGTSSVQNDAPQKKHTPARTNHSEFERRDVGCAWGPSDNALKQKETSPATRQLKERSVFTFHKHNNQVLSSVDKACWPPPTSRVQLIQTARTLFNRTLTLIVPSHTTASTSRARHDHQKLWATQLTCRTSRSRWTSG